MRTRNLSALSAVIMLQTGLLCPAAARANDPQRVEDGGAAAVLFSCRAIEDDRLRLECYDREVGALQEAEASDKVVIVDQEDLREARRGLFGFSLPKIGLFSGRGDDTEVEEIREIEDTLASFRFDPAGRAMLTLSNGARWLQSDNLLVLGEPKAGDAVRIESAALGSFKASIAGRRAIRVKRLN
jgi:hypothetical protein